MKIKIKFPRLEAVVMSGHILNFPDDFIPKNHGLAVTVFDADIADPETLCYSRHGTFKMSVDTPAQVKWFNYLIRRAETLTWGSDPQEIKLSRACRRVAVKLRAEQAKL